MTVILGCMGSRSVAGQAAYSTAERPYCDNQSINRHIDIAYFDAWLDRESALPGRKRRGWLTGYHQTAGALYRTAARPPVRRVLQPEEEILL